MSERITRKQFREAEGTEDRRLVGSDGACAYFKTRSMAQAARLRLK